MLRVEGNCSFLKFSQLNFENYINMMIKTFQIVIEIPKIMKSLKLSQNFLSKIYSRGG